MQKIINVLALASTAVSIAVVGAGGYVYLNREAIIDGVKEKAIEAVTGSMGLPVGAPDLPSPDIGSSSIPSGGGLGLPVPSSAL